MRSDLNSSFYESLYESKPDPQSFEVRSKILAFRRAFKRLKAGAQQPLRVLDVGFGGGELLETARQMHPSGKFSGVETARSAVASVAQAHPEWDIRTASADSLPFDDSSFDIVVCSHTLEHLPDDKPAVSELKRVAAPAGYIIAGVPGPASGENPLHERLYDEAMLRSLFADLRMQYLRCYGSQLFMAAYWQTRRFAQSANIIETKEVQSSRGTGSLLSRIGMAVGVPGLLMLYDLDSTLVQNRKEPFEVWGAWTKLG